VEISVEDFVRASPAADKRGKQTACCIAALTKNISKSQK
jgi:hypothetical protein